MTAIGRGERRELHKRHTRAERLSYSFSAYILQGRTPTSILCHVPLLSSESYLWLAAYSSVLVVSRKYFKILGIRKETSIVP